MIISLIIFIASLFFLLAIWYGKKLEAKRGRPMFYIGSENLDTKLRGWYSDFLSYIKSVDSVYIKRKLHDIAERLEKFSLHIAEKVAAKFDKLTSAASGKDLPKNRGAVSFLFRHIESHKGSVPKGVGIAHADIKNK